MNEKPFGSLRVRATCARGALPVRGAAVFVEKCGGGVTAAGMTDESGLTRTFELETKPLSGASPGESVPCERYDVEIRAEGFEPAERHAVAIYEGVTSSLCAELVPKLASAPIAGGKDGGR